MIIVFKHRGLFLKSCSITIEQKLNRKAKLNKPNTQDEKAVCLVLAVLPIQGHC